MSFFPKWLLFSVTIFVIQNLYMHRIIDSLSNRNEYRWYLLGVGGERLFVPIV